MNRKDALANARNILADSGITEASLEGEIILRHVLGIDRAELYTGLNLELSPEQEKTLGKLIDRRRKGEPSTYITGHRQFYGLDFVINRNVLIPRPETELLVEKAIEIAQYYDISKIADVGTGCGAIAISLAKHVPKAKVCAIDISRAALETARINCQKHGVTERVVLLCGDLLKPIGEPVDMIVANLPYVKESDLGKNISLRYEPTLALNGGKNGLDRIKNLCSQAGEKLNKDGYLLLEIGAGQAKAVKIMLRNTFPGATIEVFKDLAGIERVVGLRLTQEKTGC